MSILGDMAFADPVAPRKLDKHIPAELETITLKCLAKNAAERYPSAGVLADDLRRWLNHQTIQAKPPSLGQRVAKWSRRHRALVWAAAAVVLLAAAILGGAITWVAREAAVRRMQTEQVVKAALADAERLQDQASWPEALEAVKRAQGLLAGGTIGESLRQHVDEMATGLALVARLDEVRAARVGVTRDITFDPAWADREYAQVFQNYGIDVDALGTADLAVRIPTAIRSAVGAALDDWAGACMPMQLVPVTLARSDLAHEPKGFRRATVLLSASTAVDPDDWRGRMRAAIMAKDRQALIALASEDRTGEQPVASLVSLGDALERAKAFPEAVAVLRRAQRRYPDDFWANLALARFTDLPPPDDAVPFAMAAVALRPRSGEAYKSLSKALDAKGDYAAAVVAGREAVKLRPDDFVSRHHLGFTLIRNRDLDEALAVAREQIRLWPENGNGYYVLAHAYYAKKDAEAARAAFERAARCPIYPRTDPVNYGTVLRHCGDYDGAIAAFDKGLALKVDKELLLARIIALLLKGDWARVVAESEHPVIRDSWPGRAPFYRGYALEALGDREGAYKAWNDSIRDWERDLERNPKSAVPFGYLAKILATCGDDRISKPRRAVELAQQAVELALQPPKGAHYDLGWAKLPLALAQYAVADWEAAAATAEAAQELLPGFERVQLWLIAAIARGRCGRTDQARPWYHKAVRWLDAHPTREPVLARLRAEADSMFGKAGQPPKP